MKNRIACGMVLVLLAGGRSDAETVRLPVTRDLWLSGVGKEADGNNGAAPRLKFKSIQEMSLVDIDPAPLKGRVITGATLHLNSTGDEVLHRVTVSSFASEWVEGTGTSYEPQAGSSTYNHQRHPDVPWAFPGSNLNAVMLGQGGTIWRMADATPPDAKHWQTIAIDPSVVAARVAGVSHGFLVFDDTGSEFTHHGEEFKLKSFPNRFVYSREQNQSVAPYVTVELGEKDEEPPAAPTELKWEADDLPVGEARISWLTPSDRGGAGVIGFFVEADGKPVPRYLIPRAGKPSERVTMRLRDLPFQSGQNMRIAVKAVDGAGNVGDAATAAIKVSSQSVQPLPGKAPQPFTTGGALPRLGEADVAIIDALDKVQPVTGQMIPAQEPNYLAGNHLWSAERKQIRLHAAKNEFVSFQVLFRGAINGLKPTLHFDGAGANPTGAFFTQRFVESKAGPVPDPLLPLQGTFSVPAADQKLERQGNGTLLCEIYVPHDAAAGEKHGTLTLSTNGQSLALDVSLTVWDFTLPDFLSFIPEMNCYGLPANEADYYRLAHRNRTVLNRVPYYQNGVIADGCAPKWNGKQLDWIEWDQRFGPYLDGSAFNDLPRKGVPLEGFYLPLNENWPTPINPNYNDDYWADRAFTPAYRQAFVEASHQFAQHFNERRWNQTLFQCFFNGKNNFKERGWSRATSPWLLDEPANFQDYWALRWFGEAFHEGINQSPGSAKLLFRCDISRPEWQRDALDHVLDYNVVAGGPFRQYHRIVIDRKQDLGQVVVVYGTANNPADSNLQAVGWCLDTWTQGGDGVLPWQVIGNEESWKKADDTCLFYPGEPVRLKEPIPSIRLKAYLRGEQDVEYLALLADAQKQSPLTFGKRVREALNLTGVRKGTGFVGEDAGVIDFSHLKPQDVWALRVRIGQVLSDLKPEPRRKLVDFHAPRRDPAQGVPGYARVHAETGQ